VRDLYPDARDLGPREHPFPARYARRFTTMLIEPPIYLSAMMRDVRLAGGRVVVRELASREELQELPEPVIVNCTGLGAKALFGDEELEPVRGQLTFLLPQPEVDYIVITDGLYMFPRRDGILLGGTFEHGAWSLDVDEPTRQRMVDGHRSLFEGMR
jgi:glycine/D-amino acid oxidase-like deaminating enzyme